MPTNKQRRESARRHLERQLQRRQEREARQRKMTLIISIVATLVLIGAIILTVVLLGSGSDKKTTASKQSSSGSTPTSPSPAPSTSYPAARGASVTFDGVTVTGAADLNGSPGVTSTATKDPTKLAYKDLVVGKGKQATPASMVTVQYTGVLYKNGKRFDSSWAKGGRPIQFSLTSVVPGFTQGIGGTTGIPAMKVGGRRIITVPSAIGYGAQGQAPDIPANAPLVFVIDLKSIDG